LGEVEVLVESDQVGPDVGIVADIHDGDGLAAAVAGDAVEGDLVESVRVADLCGRVADRDGARDRSVPRQQLPLLARFHGRPDRSSAAGHRPLGPGRSVSTSEIA
jgi:hypothetical protein